MKRRSQSGSTSKPKPSAYDKALGLLARREHSSRELKRKLGQGGYQADESREALQRLGDQRYQDDQRFAEMLVRSRANQGYGPLRIRAELQSHGIGEAAIRQLLDAAAQEWDWDAQAAQQLRRRYGQPPSEHAERAKCAQFLMRRGFSGGSVRAALQGGTDEDDWDVSAAED